jgi:hypothetical protein
VIPWLLLATVVDPQPPPVSFPDVTAAAGIRFVHGFGGAAKDGILESMGGGVAFLDYNNDGQLDIFLTGGPAQTAALYRNNSDGTFTDVSAKSGITHRGWGMSATVGDYDNDGWDDLFLTYLGGNKLYRNNGDGSFTDVTAKAGVEGGGWSTSAGFADYDRDGHLDLFVARYAQIDPANVPQPGSSPYCQYRGLAVYCGPKGFPGERDILYHNNGDGTFTDVTEHLGLEPVAYFGLGVLWGDFNGDGWPDLYVANDSTPSALYINRGDGTFVEQGLLAGVAVSDDGREQAGMGVDTADYDRDGLPDIVKTNFSDDAPNLYRNLGGGSFSDQVYPAGIGELSRLSLGFGVKFFDADNDGWPDIYVGNGHVYPQVDRLRSGITYRQRNFLFLNQRNGKFREAGPPARHVTRGVASGDFDNDGRMDLLVGHLDGPPALLANRTRNGNHWIGFFLIGVQSNRNAIGALVKVDGQSLEVRANSSYLSSSDRRVHFGLGAAVRARQVEIRWPSGRTQKVENLAADAYYQIREGENPRKL